MTSFDLTSERDVAKLVKALRDDDGSTGLSARVMVINAVWSFHQAAADFEDVSVQIDDDEVDRIHSELPTDMETEEKYV